MSKTLTRIKCAVGMHPKDSCEVVLGFYGKYEIKCTECGTVPPQSVTLRLGH